MHAINFVLVSLKLFLLRFFVELVGRFNSSLSPKSIQLWYLTRLRPWKHLKPWRSDYASTWSTSSRISTDWPRFAVNLWTLAQVLAAEHMLWLGIQTAMPSAVRIALDEDGRLCLPKLLLVVWVVNDALLHRNLGDYLNALIPSLLPHDKVLVVYSLSCESIQFDIDYLFFAFWQSFNNCLCYLIICDFCLALLALWILHHVLRLH